MTSSIAQQKAALRKSLGATLKAMTEQARQEASHRVVANLMDQSVWRHANSLLAYAPLPGEVNIWPLVKLALAEGKITCLPRFNQASGLYEAARIGNPEGDLETGRYGIREPRNHCPVWPLNRLDLILVPGIGFDPWGGRLGRGRGFYDQLLAATDGIRCGVAFDEQVVDKIPLESHDFQLDYTATPSRWLVRSQRTH